MSKRNRGKAEEREELKIILFSREDCPACKVVKEWLERKGIEYELKDIDNLENFEELINLYPGFRTIPILVINGKVYSGDKLVEWVETYESLH